MNRVAYLFLIFFLYSMIGYFCETTYCSIKTKKIVVNRGFCLGPYCPIYGVGAVLMILLLTKYMDDPITLFLMGAFICSFVEYITSYILERIFKARWWDYSDKPFNIEGRICLENAILFGLGGVLVIYFVNPFLSFFLSHLSPFILNCISLICFILFLIDIILTVLTLSHLKIAQEKFNRKDATDEITKLIRLEIVKNKNLVWRLLRAFPNVGMENKKSTLYKLKVYLEKRYDKKKSFSLFSKK